MRARPAPSPAEVSYLTDGMNWSADYVAVVDADDKKAGLVGLGDDRQPLAGPAFKDATLKLVAGDVRRVAPERLMDYEAKATTMRMSAGGAAVPGRVVLRVPPLHARPPHDASRTTRPSSSRCFRRPSVPVQKRLLLTGNPAGTATPWARACRPQKVAVVLELVNAQAGGPRHAPPQGDRARLQEGQVGRRAVRRRGRDRPHAQGRDGPPRTSATRSTSSPSAPRPTTRPSAPARTNRRGRSPSATARTRTSSSPCASRWAATGRSSRRACPGRRSTSRRSSSTCRWPRGKRRS